MDLPRFKTKNWKNQGKLGNPDYKEFYETYSKAAKKEEKAKKEPSKKQATEVPEKESD